MNATLLSTPVDTAQLHSPPRSVEVPDAAQLRSLSLTHRLSLRLALWLLVRAERQRMSADRAVELFAAQQRREQLMADNRALVVTHMRQPQMY